jgi:hypothetical protein
MSNKVETSILELLCNPELREVCMGFIEEWMFSSETCKAFYKALKQPVYNGTIPTLQAFVLDCHMQHGVNEEDCEIVARVIQNAVDSSLNGRVNAEECTQQIEEFIKERRTARGVEMLAAATKHSDKVKGREMLQSALSFTISTDYYFDFSDPTFIHTARDSDFPPGGVIIKSSFSVVNRSSSFKGYKYGDLILVCARPGAGKSTTMVGEGAHAVRQGFRVCHVFIGDMSEYDGFLKYIAYWSGQPIEVILRDGYEAYYTPEMRELFSRLRVKALPADTHDVYQLLAKVNKLRRSFEFDMLVVDYDANIKSNNGDNMYGEGGNTYANLKSYGKSKCAVMIGSQSKPAFWDVEVVPMEAPAESSKKAHHVDIMLGVGRNKACRTVGTLNIAKMRRGESDVQVRLHLDYAQARMREISVDQYQELIAQSQAMGETKTFPDPDDGAS